MSQPSNGAKSIFLDALELNDDLERKEFIAERCAEDGNVRLEVERLLQMHGKLNSFMEAAPKADVTIDQARPEKAGTLIGRYKLLEQIGEGGMGLVYMAEQQQPVRRLVALKLVKPGMDSKQVIARFEAERQALAMMDHPNIAKVHDAGTTDSGRPYFVMELVRGIPVNEFCDQQKLTVRQRLELFIQVSQAVQHAHQKGIIHRDLKPTNVLVTKADTVPLPKVIDFGIAKALGASLTDHTLHTGFAQLVGTPMYMSPEQAEMNHFGVDTRSDVYSLGVLLYELLSGTTPFDKETLSKAGLDEMRRMIREDEPPRPSHRISTLSAQASSTISQQRGLDERHLGHVLRGELDWIVMKALEKDRSRRYESASALAADIQRYLSDEPVLACPPTTMYRFQKFARKHKPALFTAAAIGLCLLLGTTVSAWQAARATTAETQANENEQKAVANEQKAVANAAAAQQNEQEAIKQRDEVRVLNDQLQSTLYAAHMNLAKNAWDAGGLTRVRRLLIQHRPKPGQPDLRGFEWHYLHRLYNSELLSLAGHKDTVYALAFSPDGKRLASGSKDRTVKVWDAQTGEELFAFKGHAESVHGIAFSPDGKRLASAAFDNKVKVWDAQTGQEILTIKAGFNCVAFSPDGKKIATRSNGSGVDVKLWDAQSGEDLLTLKGHSEWLVSLAFSPDGKHLASAASDKTVRVWDTQSGKELHRFTGSGSVAFSPDGKLLASTAGDYRTVKVWDVQTGQEFFSAPVDELDSVAFAPDGQKLFCSSSGGTFRILELRTAREIRAIKGGGYGMAVSPDGKRLASHAANYGIRIWDAEKDQESMTLSGGGQQSVVFSSDGRRVASVSDHNIVKMWDSKTGQQILALKGHNGQINDLAFSPNGQLFASVAGGEVLPDGTRRSSADYPGELKLWDVRTGRELIDFPTVTGRYSSVAFSPDGKHMASASGSWGRNQPFDVKLWDVQTGQVVRNFTGHTSGIRSLVFSADGSRLAGGAAPNPDGVTVWNTQTGEAMLTLKGHKQWISGVCFSPDGQRLASSSNDATARVWDAQTGQLIVVLEGHNRHVSSVAFSPDGLRLATVALDQTLKLWDAQTGQELLTLPTESWSNSVVFSPDGYRLACDAASTVRIYDATPLAEKP